MQVEVPQLPFVSFVPVTGVPQPVEGVVPVWAVVGVEEVVGVVPLAAVALALAFWPFFVLGIHPSQCGVSGMPRERRHRTLPCRVTARPAFPNAP